MSHLIPLWEIESSTHRSSSAEYLKNYEKQSTISFKLIPLTVFLFPNSNQQQYHHYETKQGQSYNHIKYLTVGNFSFPNT